MLLGGGDKPGTTFWGYHPFKIWEGKKCLQFSTFYDNFRVRSQISLDRIEISTSVMNRNPFHTEQKNGEFWSTNTRDHMPNVYLPQVDSARSAYANAF